MEIRNGVDKKNKYQKNKEICKYNVMEIRNGVERKKKEKKIRKIKKINIQCDVNKKWCRREKKKKK